MRTVRPENGGIQQMSTDDLGSGEAPVDGYAVVDAFDDEVDFAPPSTTWAIDEVLTVVLLSGATLRIVMVVAAQLPFYSQTQGRPTAMRLGYALLGADFADGQGVLILLFIMGLVWWASVRRFESPILDPEEAVLRHVRAHRALTWLWILFVVTAIGALTAIAGIYLYYGSQYLPTGATINGSSMLATHLIGTGGLEVAYLSMALGGVWATVRLRASPSIGAFEDDDDTTDDDRLESEPPL